eukprot:CAMPEP_0117423018 /NCGR_PEP_ID=MMETSP0758-20121206/3749_1 /TAXON_ID=63605 /ORGANISM="Percolomonas cosmopolitus, Strain AE-1 (ATCC 50343)" /LENGTH=1116 /DNA_ID=CAMNT_0005206001 /DNA_START=81 /DNA_END=3431 /DNA_ORIENTATION=-
MMVKAQEGNDTIRERTYKYRVSCPPGRTRYYDYESEVDAFGDKSNAEKIKFQGRFKVQCLQAHRKKNGKDLFNIAMVIDKLKVHMKEKSKEEGWKNENEKVKRHFNLLKKDGDVTEYFKRPIHATYTSNGKVVEVFHAKNEEPWVTAIKKTIFSKFQTKLTGEERTEKDAFGKHKSHYRKQKDRRRGTLRVVKSYSDRDMPRHRFEPGHQRLKMDKQMKMDAETESILDEKTGRINKVVSHGSYDLGAQRERKHKGFFHDNQNVPYDQKHKKELSSENAFQLGQTTSITFVQESYEGLPKQHWRAHIEALEDVEGQEVPKMRVHKEYVRSHLGTDRMHPFMKKEHSKHLFASRNYKKLIKELVANPEDHAIFAKLAEMVRASGKHKKFNDYLEKTYNNVLEKYQQKKDKKTMIILKAINTLLMGTVRAGRVFSKSLEQSDEEMLKSNILAGLTNGKKWFKRAAYKLKKLYNHNNDDIRNNAYLVLANALSDIKVGDKKAKKIAKWIIQNMIRDDEDPLVHVHAMGNAGQHIPLKYLDMIIRHKDASRQMRNAAIHALRKRKDGKKILADLLSDHQTFSLEDTEAAIQVLEERDPRSDPAKLEKIVSRLFNRRTLPHLTKHRLAQLLHLRQEQLDRPMTKLVRKWKQVVRRHKLRKTNKNNEENEELAETLSEAATGWGRRRRRRRGGFIRRIRRAVRRVHRRIRHRWRRVVHRVRHRVRRAVRRVRHRWRRVVHRVRHRVRRAVHRVRRHWRRVGRVVRRVGRAIGRVAQRIGRGVRKAIDKVKAFKKKIFSMFAKATFKGNQVCMPASRNSGDRICLYDAKMVSFVQSNGDFSQFSSSKHFEWEKLIGANKIHLYLGVSAYMGTNFDCNGPAGRDFRFAVFAKGLARMVAFSKELEIFDAHAFLRQNPHLDNRGYLRIVRATIYDRQILNLDKARNKLCQNYKKNILNKRFDNMPGYSFTVMIGPIPVNFGFGFTAGLNIDFDAGYCFNDLTASTGITPAVDAGVRAHAKVSIVILKAGVEVEGLYTYQLTPGAELKGMQCKICINVKSQQRFRLNINAAADINIIVYKKSWRKTLFSVAPPPKHKTLFEKCVSFKNLFHRRSDNEALISSNQAA